MERIRNPISGKYINIDGPTFNKLIDEHGYTRNQLLSIDIQNFDTQETIPDDIMYNILLQSPIKNIIYICQTNKHFYNICNTQNFWITIFERDGIPIFKDYKTPTTYNDWIQLYYKMIKIIAYVDDIIDHLSDYKKLEIRWDVDYHKYIRGYVDIMDGKIMIQQNNKGASVTIKVLRKYLIHSLLIKKNFKITNTYVYPKIQSYTEWTKPVKTTRTLRSGLTQHIRI